MRNPLFFLFFAACAAKAPPPPAAAAKTDEAPADKPAAEPKKASEADVKAFLAAKEGEKPAADEPMPGTEDVPAADEALYAKCVAAKEKALEKNKKLPMDKQLGAALKAMDKVDKRCMDIGLARQTKGQARAKDERAQMQMRALAAALAKTTDAKVCGAGKENPKPTMDVCTMGLEEMLWDRDGWSCVAKTLGENDKTSFSMGPAYVYSFQTNADLHTYEIVGRGCHMLLGASIGNAETELVVRGRVGDAEPPVVYRRALKKK